MNKTSALKEIISEGLRKNLIRFSDDQSTITYLCQDISRNYNNPEEKIQAETFCELVLKYNYPVEQVRQYVKVTVGSAVKEADIIVYNDSECRKPHIIVECKRAEISEMEFRQAVLSAKQGETDSSKTRKDNMSLECMENPFSHVFRLSVFQGPFLKSVWQTVFYR